MINVEAAVSAKFPAFAATPSLLREPAIRFLRNLLHETEINAFLAANTDVSGFDWIERVFDYFDFSYTVSARDRANIPASGRVVIIANHPIGSLDGLALLRLVGEVRRDVKIVANDLLANFTALEPLLIPVDVMAGGSALRSYRRAIVELEQEHAVIVFPAGEVSRASPLGVRDTLWRPGFLHFARKANAPVLPVHIAARNSLLFYSASMLFKPFGTVLLSDEMFKHQSGVIHFHVGEAIPCAKLHSDGLHDRTLVARLRKHLYKLGRPHKATFETERTVAHPEHRQLLQQELKQAQLLGVTRDNNAIYLLAWSPDSAVIREIGRLRELAFRKVGEGTGKRRDLDRFDRHYHHLVLWDREAMEIAGAYRLGVGAELLQGHLQGQEQSQGLKNFYTHSLYQYQPELVEYLRQGVELGRSFVNPAYWGKASLDYLWQGIGCYLAHHPEVRYLLGPVSVSASYPRALSEELVFFFTTYYGTQHTLATAHQPFTLSADAIARLEARYADHDREQGFALLLDAFSGAGYRVPVLYRQYTALFEDDGFQVLVFSIDPDFSDCLDGFCMADLSRLKASKRERYIAVKPRSRA
jgi:putative hemolysin